LFCADLEGRRKLILDSINFPTLFSVFSAFHTSS
jgi:hypothetical protein